MLPILVGVGITTIALAVRSGFRAWSAFKRLTPSMIAQLNGVKLSRDVGGSNGRFPSKMTSELRARLDRYPGGFSARMTEAEALLILDISPGDIPFLDAQMLKKKHRGALIQNHPDRGGSPYLAMKVNEARDVLQNSIMLKCR
ncbi:LAMI_0C00540g1_1 [Lachancea mirantina]|uniref:LAMI_0C00540g1_1 n=1 Tax=Lachancea mirantina TaxID=1230905 RepID=A0A1G4IZJ6_9SACH|nr:LAMI_0C00540g1_1 [Lachancea mirantina]